MRSTRHASKVEPPALGRAAVGVMLRPMRRLTPLVVLLLGGCGNAPPVVPPAEPAPGAACNVLEPPAAQASEPAPNLGALRPGTPTAPGKARSVEALLAMHHPPAEAQWRALPPTADDALVMIARDTDAPVTRRARALSALALRGAPQGRAQLGATLSDAQADATLRRTSARALADAFLATDATALEPLRTALADDDPQLRAAVVQALAPHATREDVPAALQARAAAEQDAQVKAALDAALTPPSP